jgi:hypothetical protein
MREGESMERDKMDPRGAKAFGALQKVGFLARASTVAWWALFPLVSAMIHKQQVKETNCFLQFLVVSFRIK